MFDDKFLGPVFPTRNGEAAGAGQERTMLDSVGANSIRTKIVGDVMLRTRNGMPEFTRLNSSSSGESTNVSGIHLTISGMTPFVLQVLPKNQRPLLVAANLNRVVTGYSMWGTVGAYIYGSTVVRGTGRSLSGSVLRWGSLVATAFSSAVLGDVTDYAIPTAAGIAGATHVDGVKILTLPTRKVFVDVGEISYKPLPPTVFGADRTSTVHRCYDAQTFNDIPREGNLTGIVTDKTKYYVTAVNDSAASTIEGKIDLNLNYSATSTSNSDGVTAAQSYPCQGWRITLIYDADVEPDRWPSYWNVAAATGDVVNEALCGDWNNVRTASGNSGAVSVVALDGAVSEATHSIVVSYALNEDCKQRYSSVGMGRNADAFYQTDDRWTPYFVRLARNTEYISTLFSESLSASSGIQAGGKEYLFFSASGESGLSGEKNYDNAFEGFHTLGYVYDENDGGWYVKDATTGQTRRQVFEATCGHELTELMGWAGSVSWGYGKSNNTVLAATETDLINHCQSSMEHRHYLVVDTVLGFVSYLKFTMAFDLTVNSSSVDAEWKWKMYAAPPATPIAVSVSIVAEYDGTTHVEPLYSGTMIKSPPVVVRPLPNPYYFRQLSYGTVQASILEAHGADVTYAYQVPKFDPQPSFYASVDTIFETQQTNPHIAGFSKDDMSALGLTDKDQTIVVSRQFTIAGIGADALFGYYGLADPLPGEERPYGYSNDLYRLIYERSILFQFDNIRGLSSWVKDFSQEPSDAICQMV